MCFKRICIITYSWILFSVWLSFSPLAVMIPLYLVYWIVWLKAKHGFSSSAGLVYVFLTYDTVVIYLSVSEHYNYYKWLSLLSCRDTRPNILDVLCRKWIAELSLVYLLCYPNTSYHQDRLVPYHSPTKPIRVLQPRMWLQNAHRLYHLGLDG